MDNKTIRKIIQNHLAKGEFNKILLLFSTLNREAIILIIKFLAYDEGISAYTLLCLLIFKENIADYHSLAAHLFALPLCSYKDANSLGLYHALQSVTLNPNDVSNKELVLFFNRVPEPVLTKDKAIQLAKEIIQQKPSSGPAQEVLIYYNETY